MPVSSIPSDVIPWGGLNVDVSAGDATFDPPIRGFQLAVAGDVKVDWANGCSAAYATSTFPACIAGVRYEGYIKKIYMTGTTEAARANIHVFA